MSEEARKLGKYELQSRLAQGGMGEVWKGFDSQLKRIVAIKLLRTDLQHDSEFTMRFEREAQLIAALRHPNIIQIHDFDITMEGERTAAYMVMDYVKGNTLADYIRSTSRKGNFPGAEDITYLFAITSLALDYAHGKGMIHRDIKPANILLDQRMPSMRSMGEPILTDFGIARLQGVASGTMLGSLLGTPLYISPEQAQGQHGDKRSDLYSLGIILYEMATGVTPFRGETTMAILMQQVHEIPTPPALINPNIPAALSNVILKSIAKLPEDRYQSASEMSIALAEALHAPLPERFIQTLRANTRTPLSTTPAPSNTDWTRQSSMPLQPLAEGRQSRPPTLTPQQSKQAIMQNTPIQEIKTNFPPLSQTFTPPQQVQKTKGPWLSKRLSFILLPLVFLLISAGVTTFLLQQNKAQTPPQKVGTLQISAGSNQVSINIDSLNPPGAGHTYYAWIEGNGESISPPHWSLVVKNNAVHTVLQVSQLNDLLANHPLFLITDETIENPIVPYTNPQNRLYYAQLNTTTSSFVIQSCPSSDSSNVCMG
jgi:eukaryotic-like serine/threonine-protein kinase